MVIYPYVACQSPPSLEDVKRHVNFQRHHHLQRFCWALKPINTARFEMFSET